MEMKARGSFLKISLDSVMHHQLVLLKRPLTPVDRLSWQAPITIMGTLHL
jgi:hypothetical protein